MRKAIGIKMKKQTTYLILFIIDVLLIILWPIAAAITPAKWYAFIAGVCWLSDWIDAVRHWKGYKAYKAMGE